MPRGWVKPMFRPARVAMNACARRTPRSLTPLAHESYPQRDLSLLRRTWILVAVVVTAAVVRLLWVMAARPVLGSDFAWYVGAAQRLAEGLGYSMPDGKATAFWPVGWPLVLSVVFRLGMGLAGAYAVQIACGAATAGLVYVGARRIEVAPRPAAAVAMLYALLPGQATSAAILGTEPLFTLLITASIVTLLGRPLVLRTVVLSAALMGGATLVRPTTLVWPAVLLVILLLRHLPLRRALAMAGVTAGVMAIILAPLTIRNAVRFGALMPVSTNGGINLWQGTQADNTYWKPVGPPMSLPTEVERDAAARAVAINYWIQHPIEMLNRVPVKLRFLWESDDDSLLWMAATKTLSEADYRSWAAIANLSYWALLGLAVAGALKAWRARREVYLLLVGFVGYYTMLFAFFPAWSRFHQPLIPVIAILGACGLASVWPPRPIRGVPPHPAIATDANAD